MSPAPVKMIMSGARVEVRGGPEMEAKSECVVIEMREECVGQVSQGLSFKD